MVWELNCDCSGHEETAIDSSRCMAAVDKGIEARLSDGIFAEVPVDQPCGVWHSDKEIWLHIADKWYQCQACGTVWELVLPDFPAKGRFGKRLLGEPAFQLFKLTRSYGKHVVIQYTDEQKAAFDSMARSLVEQPMPHILSAVRQCEHDGHDGHGEHDGHDGLQGISLCWRLMELLRYAKELSGAAPISLDDLSFRIGYMFFELSRETADMLAEQIQARGSFLNTVNLSIVVG